MRSAVFSLLLAASMAAVASATTNTMEIRAFIDRKAFNDWKTQRHITSDSQAESDLREFLNGVFAGVNRMFDTGLSDVSLDARVVEYIFVKHEQIERNVFGNSQAASNAILTSFRDWLNRKHYGAVDHSMMFTGWDLSKGTDNRVQGNTGVAGVALLGQMCKGESSVSAIELRGVGSIATTIAHELGHSLNSKHDGDGNGCSKTSQMIMEAVGTTNSTTQYTFSQCSLGYIKPYVDSFGSCLRQTTTPQMSDRQLGEIYTIDEICQIAVGSHSYFGRSFYGEGKKDYDMVCRAIYCKNSGNQYDEVRATDGIVCGHGKRCNMGSCENDWSVSNPASCLFGDLPSHAAIYEGKSCAEHTNNGVNKRMCYNAWFATSCCETCTKSSDPSCPYGNQDDTCSTLDKWTCEANSEICCAGCDGDSSSSSSSSGGYSPSSNTRDRPSTGSSGGSSSSGSCKDLSPQCSTMTGPNCYVNKEVCCKTCQKFKTYLPGNDCEFGDKSPQCSQFAALTGRNKELNCKRNYDNCCKTCQGYKS